MDLWLLFVPSCLICIITAVSMYFGARSKGWPTVEGTILFSDVTYNKEELLSNGKGFIFYRPVVHYEYIVGSRHFMSKRIGNYMGFGNNRELAENIVSPFPKGKIITVYYHPKYHGYSALIPGPKQNIMHIALLLVSIVLTVISGSILFS